MVVQGPVANRMTLVVRGFESRPFLAAGRYPRDTPGWCRVLEGSPRGLWRLPGKQVGLYTLAGSNPAPSAHTGQYPNGPQAQHWPASWAPASGSGLGS